MKPSAPPPRPHSANPNMSLTSSFFPRSVTPTSRQNSTTGGSSVSLGGAGPHSNSGAAPTHHIAGSGGAELGSGGGIGAANASALSLSQRAVSASSFRETEWEDEDAWDSSSDRDDDGPGGSGSTRMTSSMDVPVRVRPLGGSSTSVVNVLGGSGTAGAAPIPIRSATSRESTAAQAQAIASSISASWASASFHHVSPPSSSSVGGASRPVLATAKTYTSGVPPPPPGTAPDALTASGIAPGPGIVPTGAGVGMGGSKLPPGGAWEIVDPADIKDATEPEPEPAQVGKEVIRPDVEDILKDPLQLLQSLSLSAPPTPIQTAASSFPFLPTTPTGTTSSLSPSTTSPAGGILSTPSGQSSSVTWATPTHLTATPVDATPGSPARGGSAPGTRRDGGVSRQRSVRTERRRDKFQKVLRGRQEDGGGVDLAELRRLAWSGVPSEVRPIVWQLLLNYLPLPVQPRLTTLQRKRKEYSQLVDQYFGRGLASLDQQIWHQIEIDVPRTRPGAPLWSCPTTQRSLERILYVWAIRHPASGYVQGINDLATPFFEVFLSAYVDTDPELFDVGLLEPHVLAAIEADSFWCLTKLLDGIQDHYISQQPGIQRLVKRMSELVKRIDAPLAAHFEEQGVEFMQFAFRWMNCLLMREISVKCTIRMWDTYLAEGADAFSQFHLYVCSALLVKFSDRLREMDFQEIIIFLQCLPTHKWSDHEIELLLSEAYVLKTVWQGAENHFANLGKGGGGFGMLGR